MRDWLEDRAENVIFASRWLLAPFYLGLIGALLIILVKFGAEFWRMLAQTPGSTPEDVVLQTLSMLDLALLANLVLIVIFAGYENFVSKIGAAEQSEDRPQWMGHVDFSGLKIKLIGSLVAISVIELLKDFEHARGSREITDGEIWRVVLHVTFLCSGVLFAVMDYLADKRTIMNSRHALEIHEHTHRDPGAAQAVEVALGP